MSLFKGVQIALILSTASLAVSTIPLAALGDQPIELRLNYQTQFSGLLREAATPYLGLAALFSCGIGGAAFGITVGRASRNQYKEAQVSLHTLQAELEKKEAQIQSLQTSETRLRAAGLDSFVQDADDWSLPSISVSSNREVTIVSSEPQAAAMPRMTSHAIEGQSTEKRVVPTFSVQAGYTPSPLAYDDSEISTHISEKSIGRLQTEGQPHLLSRGQMGKEQVQTVRVSA